MRSKKEVSQSVQYLSKKEPRQLHYLIFHFQYQCCGIRIRIRMDPHPESALQMRIPDANADPDPAM
jgi:hypothetical protein